MTFASLVFRPLHSVRRELLITLAGLVVALGLWGVRNALVTGHFTVSTSSAGIALWESNGPFAARALWLGQVEALSTNPDVMALHWSQTASMSENEANRYYLGTALRHMASNPLNVATTAAQKILVTALGIRPELPLRARRNVIALISSATLLVLAIAGWRYLSRRSRSECWEQARHLFLIVGLTVFAFLAVGPIGLRYRLMLDGVLWICSAAAIMEIASHYRGSARFAGRP